MAARIRRSRDERRRAPGLENGPAVVCFSHSGEAVSVEARPAPHAWRSTGQWRYQVISRRGGVSFCGPPGIRVRPGDEYLLSVSEDWRPLTLANRTLGVSWDLRVASPPSRRTVAMIGAAACAWAGLLLIAGAYWVDDALDAVERLVRRLGPGAEAVSLSDQIAGVLRAALLFGAAACGAGALALGLAHWIRRRRHDADAELWIRRHGDEPGWVAVEADASGQVVATSRRRW